MLRKYCVIIGLKYLQKIWFELDFNQKFDYVLQKLHWSCTPSRNLRLNLYYED